MTPKEKTIKENTIKWLLWNVDEINNNHVAMRMPKEDEKLNDKDLKELMECINWVQSK